VELEIRHGHLSREHERNRSREEAEEEEGAAHELENAGEPGMGTKRPDGQAAPPITALGAEKAVLVEFDLK
jgi:hypothetical protein